MKEYDSKSIIELSDIDSIITNPGMYIGNTSNPSHLLTEVIDNSIDEAASGYCKSILILLNNDNYTFTVIDDGRGIPIDNDVPIKISSQLFTGSKFKGKEKSYSISVGMHGVGLVAVNALSEFFEIEIYRDNKHAIFQFQNSKIINTEIKYSDQRPFSTKIKFKPSKKIFESLKIDYDFVIKKLNLSSIYIPQTKIAVISDNTTIQIKNNKETFFREQLIGNDDSTDFIFINSQTNNIKLDIVLSYSNNKLTSKIFSSVNLIPTTEGGTHQNLLIDNIRKYFDTQAKKYKKKFSGQDCICGLRAFVSLIIEDPEFSGQTKQKLSIRKSRIEKVFRQFVNKLSVYFDNNQEYLFNLFSKFEKYRRIQEAKKITSKGKKLLLSSTKLKDCISRKGELFIVEGDSAAGSFILCRDVNKHAILPLKGKPPSVASKREKILNNNEVAEIIKSLGTGFGDNFNISKLRYSKIIISADADPDGNHISSLLILLFATLLPEIITSGKLFVSLTPLYAIVHKKDFCPLWTKQELDDARSKNKNIVRFKGLGEFSPHQLKICALNEESRKLIPITMTKNINKVLKLFLDANEKRNLLNGDFKI